MIEVIKPGLYTTVQDKGRYGYQASGIIVGGAMDSLSYELGNRILKEENTPAFEFALVGPTLKFHQPTMITITGAECMPLLDGQPFPMWRPMQVSAGATLSIGIVRRGMYGYVFVKGIKVPSILGSVSTYEKAGLGKQLQKGDMFHFIPSSQTKVHWFLNPLQWEKQVTIRVIKGTEYDLFTEESVAQFLRTSYTVTTESNRMGYRLQGEPLQQKVPQEMLSAAVTFGTVQVPPNGQPIILMADRQTTGGYAKVAQVISADLAKLAQCTPGTAVHFQLVSVEEAQVSYIREQQALRLLTKIIP